jgi:hypothetical protein
LTGAENPLLQQAVTDPNVIALLDQASTLTADPNQFGEAELRQLYAQGLIPRLPPPTPPGTTYQTATGNCNPGDTAPGLVCAPTSDWVGNPGQFLNAFTGNMVMSHGCGTIGQMLSAVGQLYSHQAMVTKNRVEVRHSTANQDRISDSWPDGLPGDQRLNPSKMQFGFPGTGGPSQTYSADQITQYYCVQDPAFPNGGGTSGERHCNPSGNICDCPAGTWRQGLEVNPDPEFCLGTDITPVPPLSVRPPATAATQELPAVAAQELSIQGHYRFFAYSRADEAPGLPGPSTSDQASAWAVNTEATVCSSFNRLAAAAAGLPLSPTRSQTDRVPDGMRSYTVPERLAGGVELNAIVENQVSDMCWNDAWVGLLVVPSPAPGLFCNAMAANIGNQMANCFASDACSDTTPAWMNTGTGVAVSPDDIMRFWEPPPTGTYGYNEPLVYVPYSFRHAYRWIPAAADGSLAVTVYDSNHNLLDGVSIFVNGVLAGLTTAGTLQVSNQPPGAYDVRAQLYNGPSLMPSKPDVPTYSTIAAMPACPSPDGSSPCMVPGNSPCPGGWGQDFCDAGGACLNPPSVGRATPCIQAVVCACYPPPSPPASCNLWQADRPANVTSNNTTAVPFTLCTGSTCPDSGPLAGVPGLCAQFCTPDAGDCQAGFSCSTGEGGVATCEPPSRIVEITGTALVTVSNYGLFQCSGVASFVPYDITCDPNSTPNGGQKTFDQCAQDADGDQDQLDWSVTCVEDPGSGGIFVTNQVRLMRGCGSNAQDQSDTIKFNATVSPTQPTVLTDGTSCFSGSPFCPAQSTCANTDNGGPYDDVDLGTITYTDQAGP